MTLTRRSLANRIFAIALADTSVQSLLSVVFRTKMIIYTRYLQSSRPSSPSPFYNDNYLECVNVMILHCLVANRVKCWCCPATICKYTTTQRRERGREKDIYIIYIIIYIYIYIYILYIYIYIYV